MTTAKVLTAAEAVHTVLADALVADGAVVLIGEAVEGGAGTTRGLSAAFPDRVLQLPVADRGAVGVALGLALAGKRPVVELADTSRMLACAELLAEAALVARDGDLPLVIRVPYGVEAGSLDAPISGHLLDTPGIEVVCPASGATFAGLLVHALASRRPTIVLEPRALYGERSPLERAARAPEGRLVRSGRDITLLAWGASVRAASDAAESLALDGIEADVIALEALAPLPRTSLGERVRATGRVVVVHADDPALARRVRELVVDEAFLYLESPLVDVVDRPERIAAVARESVRY